MPDQTYQLPRDSTMQGIVTQLQNIASRMSGNGSGGSGSGSNVVANPSGTASDDLTSIEIDGTVYDIPSGSGSSYDDTALRALINSKSTVVANPQGTPDGELTAIEIDGDIYEIVGSGGSGGAVGSGQGGGSSYESKLIYDGSALSSLQSSIELDDRWDNYDALYLTFKFNGDGSTFGGLILKEQLLEALNHTYTAIGSYTQNYVGAHIVNDYKTFNQIYGGGNQQQNIYAVYGIKFGSGSGSGGASSEVIPIEAGDGTLSRTFQLNKTPSMVIMSYFEGENDSGWSSQYVLIWGSARAYGTATGTPTSTTGESKTVGITYGADGKSFTINAANAGSALNTTTGHGYLLCFYNEGGGSSSEESGYSITNLFTGSASAVGDYELSDSILNYDDLEFIFKINAKQDGSTCPYRISAQEFYDRFKYGTVQADTNMMINLWDNTAFRITLGPNDDPESIHVLANYVGSSVGSTLVCVNGIKYGSGGSSSSGEPYSRTELFKSSMPQQGVISLSDAIDNYDDIEIVMGWVTASDTASHTERFNAKYFVTNFPYAANPTNANPHALLEMWASNGFSCAVGDDTNTSLQTWGYNGGSGILAVYGIKYGSSGGGSSTEVVSIAAGDGTNSRTFTFTKKPKFVHMWYTVPDKWSMTEDIFWGQPWGVYDCTNGNAPYSSGAQGSNTIAFDDVNLTMTITGINALGCANNTNGYGWMFVDYGEGGGGSSQEEYSTTEKVIGKWINGKPLYQKTVYSANLGTGMKVPIAHGISNLGVVVGVEASCFDSGTENAWFPLSHISTDGYNIGVFSVDGTNINFSNPVEFGSRIVNVYATIKYTKSTD